MASIKLAPANVLPFPNVKGKKVKRTSTVQARGTSISACQTENNVISFPMGRALTESAETSRVNLDSGIGERKERKEENMGINSSIPLGDFIRFWLDTYKVREVKHSTYMRLDCSLTTLQRNAISQIPIGEIEAMTVERYLGELVNKRYSFSTIKKQKELITASMKAACKLGYVCSNKCADASLPRRCAVKKRTRLVLAYTNAEQERLRAILETFKKPGYALAELIFETGMRVGEALALNWDDVLWDRRRIWVHATVVNPLSKGGAYVQEGAKSQTSNREILLSDKALRILEMLNEQPKGDWVFAGRDGERLTYEALKYQIKAACREADVPYRGMHCFRHCFATNMYHKGLDIKKLSMLLGHSSTAITYDIYIHPNEDDDEEILKIMN